MLQKLSLASNELTGKSFFINADDDDDDDYNLTTLNRLNDVRQHP